MLVQYQVWILRCELHDEHDKEKPHNRAQQKVSTIHQHNTRRHPFMIFRLGQQRPCLPCPQTRFPPRQECYFSKYEGRVHGRHWDFCVESWEVGGPWNQNRKGDSTKPSRLDRDECDWRTSSKAWFQLKKRVATVNANRSIRRDFAWEYFLFDTESAHNARVRASF